MSAPLYMIASNYRAILQMALDEGLDADEELRQALHDIRDELAVKADNICYVRKALLEEEASLKAEAKRLVERAKVRENKAARMEEYLKSCLEGAGVTKVRAAHFNVNIVKGREILIIDDEAKISNDFWVQPPKELDKGAVKRALQAKEEVNGARLGIGDAFIVIK